MIDEGSGNAANSLLERIKLGLGYLDQPQNFTGNVHADFVRPLIEEIKNFLGISQYDIACAYGDDQPHLSAYLKHGERPGQGRHALRMFREVFDECLVSI